MGAGESGETWGSGEMKANGGGAPDAKTIFTVFFSQKIRILSILAF